MPLLGKIYTSFRPAKLSNEFTKIIVMRGEKKYFSYHSCLCVALFSLINSVMFGTTSIFNAKRNSLSGIKYFLQAPFQDENYQKSIRKTLPNAQYNPELRSLDHILPYHTLFADTLSLKMLRRCEESSCFVR